MDDIVRQAMAKWPHVPDCFGWLGLDTRGQWWLRDAQAQAAGAFASGAAGAKGSRLEHAGLIAFIHRNYTHDACGRWFFQNGPQRVYVELAATPWVWRVADDASVSAHTGQATQCIACLLDERGWVYLETPLGVGLVHTQDVSQVAQALESGRWVAHTLRSSELSARYGFVLSPAAATTA
ncbi:MAG: DUF2946 family protein [Rhodoferax sp.]